MKWLLIVMLAACRGKNEDGAGSAAPAKHGDLVVELGECSPPGAVFVSGPPSRSGQTLAITGADDKFTKQTTNVVLEAPASAGATGELDKAVIRRYVKRNIQHRDRRER